jgi:membrane-bound ClpP family serine protease
MPFAVAVLGHPGVAYCLAVTALAGLVYASVARAAFVPGFTGVAATLLAFLAYLHEPPSVLALAGLAAGVALMNLEFLLPTFGCAGVSGIATALWASWRLLEPCASVNLPWSLRMAFAIGGTGLLLGAIGRAWRLRTLPA